MDFWGFFRGSENPSVLMRTRILRLSKNLKKALISSQTSLLTKQTLYIRLFVFCLFVPCPHGYPVSRGVPKIKIVRILIKKLSQNRQNFDEILTFLGKFLRARVLVVRNRARFCQKLKRSQNYDDFATRAAAPNIPASFLSVALTTFIYGFLLPP